MKLPESTAYVIMIDHALLTQIAVQLEANTKALEAALDQLGNTRYYEEDAAKYMGVQKCTMYNYRERGLPHEKVGRVISYLRKDLDAWREKGRTQTVNTL